jgi:hypothetical protein
MQRASRHRTQSGIPLGLSTYVWCATNAWRFVKRCCGEDEGRPLGVAFQEEASNHPLLLRLRDVVVSERGKGAAGPRQVCIEKMSESEPLMTCRKVQMLSKPGEHTTPGMSLREA